MRRYIDAKWLQESLELADECKDCKRNVDKCVYSNIDVGVVCNAVDDAPSVDIVRCGECKWLRYCETENLDPYLDCDKPDGGGIPRNEEWFCADGERREP